MLQSYDAVIAAIFAKVKYGTGNISLLQFQINFIKSLHGSNPKAIIISFGNPYLLKEFPAVPNYICAYGDADVSINAFLKTLSGEIPFKGKLPISITDEYSLGTGILK